MHKTKFQNNAAPAGSGGAVQVTDRANLLVKTTKFDTHEAM